MKAKQWVEKFGAEGTTEEIMLAYANETKTLIAERTKGSGVFAQREVKYDTTPGVIDGVLREQRQKWDAISRKLALGVSFDIILGLHLADVVESQNKWKDATAKAKQAKIKKEGAGRCLVTKKQISS